MRTIAASLNGSPNLKSVKPSECRATATYAVPRARFSLKRCTQCAIADRKRNAFHPDLNRASLEERLVLSVPPGFTFVTPQQALQFRAAFGRVLRSTEFGVRTEIQAQARQLFASGTPTAQQLADFEANADGTILAGTNAIANMFALLPGSQRQLVPGTARALLASSQNSLLSRVHNVVANSSDTSSVTSLETALTRNVRSAFGNVGAQATQFLANQNLNRDVLFASDGSESLSQFIGDRIISQFGNNLGNLALAFPTVANSVLFANGADTASPAAIQQFNQLATPALGLAAFTLGNELQLLPNGTSVIPALQNALFSTTTGTTGTATGTTGTVGTTGTTTTTPTSLFAALQALPMTSTDFANAVPSVFSTAFSNLTGVLSPFVGTFPTPTFTLKSTPAAGVFSSNFTGSTFQSGFLNGFGSGFVGFGVAPTTLNTNLGTGFNNFVSTANPTLGFITPPITVSTGAGTGVVGTVGVTTGSGAGTGTGTTTTGTGTGTGTGGGTTGTGTIG